MFSLKKKNEIAKAITEINIQPFALKNENDLSEYTQFSLAQIGSLSSIFEPILKSLQKTGDKKEETLYRAVLPKVKGVYLAKAHGETAFIGTAVVDGKGIVGQTRFVEASKQSISSPVNPATLYMAIALMSVNKKLENVEEAGKQIMAFLEEKERAALEGNLEILTDIFNKYKFNIDNAMYKTNNYSHVGTIKSEAEKSIKLYRSQIENELKKRTSFHNDHNVEDKIQKIQKHYKNYQLALHLYGFAYFLEVILFENFEKGYLESVSKTLENHCEEYKMLYNTTCAIIDEYSQTSMQTYTTKAISGISKGTGKLVSKIPFIKKTNLKKNLISAGEHLDQTRTEQTTCVMEKTFSGDIEFIAPFIENIQTVNTLYNEPVELLFDNETLYIKNA